MATQNKVRLLSREELFRLSGLNDFTNDYTPVTIGKNNKLGSARYIWADNMCRVNFTNCDELGYMKPEDVEKMPLYHKDNEGAFRLVDGWNALVGKESGMNYAIHTNVYQPIQHSVIIDAMVEATETSYLSVFGNVRTDKGNFNGFANIANPDCHIQMNTEFDSPIMLGMRFYNNHMGTSKFGGEIYGIRKVCGNYLAMGEVLGSFSAKHYTKTSSLIDGLAKVLRSYMDMIEPLADKYHVLKDRILTGEEQTAYFYGLKFNQKQVLSMDTYKRQLNPEIKENVTAYDLYNVATAYTTYKTASDIHINGTLNGSHKAETSLIRSVDSILDDGFKIWNALKETPMAVA